MISHTMYALRPFALGLLFLGLAIGATGMITGGAALMRAGMLTSFAVLPAAVLGMVQRAHTLADDQLADAHRAGYELALDHVARGLLDQPADHTPPHGARYRLEDLEPVPGVRRLHALPNPDERHAV